ncbi:MAG TPA: transporter, partial [Cupriavidus sp.]|nr:transporter [Cupriavidus sp.]
MKRAGAPVLAAIAAGSLMAPLAGHATEGALGRPVAGTSVSSNVAVIPDQPVWIANLQQLYMDGSISGGRQVPIGGRTTLGVDAKIAFTLATLMKV